MQNHSCKLQFIFGNKNSKKKIESVNNSLLIEIEMNGKWIIYFSFFTVHEKNHCLQITSMRPRWLVWLSMNMSLVLLVFV